MFWLSCKHRAILRQLIVQGSVRLVYCTCAMQIHAVFLLEVVAFECLLIHCLEAYCSLYQYCAIMEAWLSFNDSYSA